MAAFDSVAVWATGITAVLGLGALAWRLARPLRRLIRLFEDFADDWHGVPGRPGVESRPGVMERLARIEGQMQAVAHEVRPNNGASMRDAVDQANLRLARLCHDPDNCSPPAPPPPGAPGP